MTCVKCEGEYIDVFWGGSVIMGIRCVVFCSSGEVVLYVVGVQVCSLRSSCIPQVGVHLTILQSSMSSLQVFPKCLVKV